MPIAPSFHLDARDAVMAASEEGEEEKLLGGGNNDVDRTDKLWLGSTVQDPLTRRAD